MGKRPLPADIVAPWVEDDLLHNYGTKEPLGPLSELEEMPTPGDNSDPTYQAFLEQLEGEVYQAFHEKLQGQVGVERAQELK